MKIRFDCNEIELSRITIENSKFRISSRNGFQSIRESLDRTGLINAPILLPENDLFIIVSGFKRLEAAHNLKWGKIRCRILPQETSFAHCARLAVADNSFQRELNVIEISKAAALLGSCFNDSQLTDEAAVLNLPSQLKRLKSLEPLHRLPAWIRHCIVSGSIATPIAIELTKMSEKEALPFARVFANCNCSLSKQREIITLVKEIAARDEETTSQILSQKSLRNIISDPDLDKNKRAGQIRTILRKIRYPNITAAEKRYAETVRDMRLSDKIKLAAPRNFEGETYSFTIQFKNIDELKAHRDKLNELIEGPEIKKILS